MSAIKQRVILTTLTTLAASAGFVLAQSQYTSLQVPKQIQYQGRVATSTGGAWSETEGYFTFALVQGATVLWNNWEGTASPSDPGAVSLGAGQVLTLPVNQGVFSIRLGEGSDTNEQIPATVFFDTVSNSVRTGVKLAVWFSPSGSGFTRLSPDVDFTSVPFAIIAGIAESVKERAVTTAMLADGAAAENIGTGGVLIQRTQLAPGLIGTSEVQDGSLIAADMSASLQADSLIPTGSVMPFAGIDAPAGWWFCDGSSQLRNDPTFARLFGVIGARHGGDANHFNLPDYRGRFLRGVDGTAGRDPNSGASVNSGADGNRIPMNNGGSTGNAVGSVQGAATKIYTSLAIQAQAASSAGNNSVVMKGNTSVGSRADFAGVGGGDSETRPINAYVNYIIKL